MMQIQLKNCEYYINKLCIDSVREGKVKKESLIKCLNKVLNSTDKMGYRECNNRINYLKGVLSSRGSKMMDKKLALLDSILSSSAKVNYNIDTLQYCMINMQFKRNFLWKKDLGVSKKETITNLNQDLAQNLKFNLLKRDFIKIEREVMSSIDKKLTYSQLYMNL